MKLLSSPFYSPAGQTQPLLFEAIVVVRVVVVVASSCSNFVETVIHLLRWPFGDEFGLPSRPSAPQILWFFYGNPKHHCVDPTMVLNWFWTFVGLMFGALGGS